MVKSLGFHKHFEKEMSLFYYILSLLGIAGFNIDIFTIYLKNPNYELYLNIISFILLISGCVLYYRKAISLKAGFAIALYTIYGNLLLSNYGLVHEKFHEFYLLRGAIFTSFLVTASFLFINKKHGLFIGITYLIFYTYAVFDSGSEFLISNLFIIFVVFICYILTLNLFYRFIDRSVIKIKEDALILL